MICFWPHLNCFVCIRLHQSHHYLETCQLNPSVNYVGRHAPAFLKDAVDRSSSVHPAVLPLKTFSQLLATHENSWLLSILEWAQNLRHEVHYMRWSQKHILILLKIKILYFLKINHRSINLKTWLSAFFVKDVSRYNFRTVVVRWYLANSSVELIKESA